MGTDLEAEQLLGSRREARRFARVVKLLLASCS